MVHVQPATRHDNPMRYGIVLHSGAGSGCTRGASRLFLLANDKPSRRPRTQLPQSLFLSSPDMLCLRRTPLCGSGDSGIPLFPLPIMPGRGRVPDYGQRRNAQGLAVLGEVGSRRVCGVLEGFEAAHLNGYLGAKEKMPQPTRLGHFSGVEHSHIGE